MPCIYIKYFEFVPSACVYRGIYFLIDESNISVMAVIRNAYAPAKSKVRNFLCYKIHYSNLTKRANIVWKLFTDQVKYKNKNIE